MVQKGEKKKRDEKREKVPIRAGNPDRGIPPSVSRAGNGVFGYKQQNKKELRKWYKIK